MIAIIMGMMIMHHPSFLTATISMDILQYILTEARNQEKMEKIFAIN
jgi:hypothetical protein